MDRRSFLGGMLSAPFLVPTAKRFVGNPNGAQRFPIRFEDIGAHAGLNAVTVYGGRSTNKYILETTGCGAAFFDYDHDGWLDIFLVNGSTLEGGGPLSPKNRLYHNNRNGTFTDVTQKAGLSHSGWGQGVAIGDYDNDGFDDLFVTYWGQNILYHNNGNGTFTDVTEKARLIQPERHWGAGCAFLDYDRDGFVDLFVTNYVNFDLQTAPVPGSSGCVYRGTAVNCGPRGLPKDKSRLYHNNRDGTFTDVTAKSGIDQVEASYGLGVLVSDFNNDFYPDVYVANDSEPSYLFWNNKNGTFTEGGMAAGVATSADGRSQSGMGVTAGDYDCDGRLDIFKTNFSDDIPNLYRNLGGGLFEDDVLSAGLGLHSRFLGWGCGFFDADNDGWLDIFYVNGHVYPEVDRLNVGITYREPMVFYKSLGNGKFKDVSSLAGPAFLEKLAGRGCAFGDVDNDGLTDILVNPINDRPRLLRCTSSSGNRWITLKLIGTKSNRSAIGARVKCVTGKHQQIDEVRSGGSFMSQNDLRIHFGLAKASQIDCLEIGWPSGHIDRLTRVRPNQFMTVCEGQTS